MRPDEICQLPGAVLAERIREGAVTPEAAVAAVLERIARLDPAYNAYALVDAEGALRAARAADAARARGDRLGPLHGTPFSVKDLIATQGLETAFGSRLMAGQIPARDAVVVARMKAAGAVLLGKTTTPEFAHKALTDSPRYGPTRNPWNPDYSPGGSSGGAAVAAATGMGALTVTTDGAGSSRIPASCCGVLGLKATLGRVPNEAAADLFGNFIFLGAIARTTEDVAAMLNVMSGPDAGDPWTRGVETAALVVPAEPLAALRGLRVHYKPLLGNRLLDDGVAAAMEATLAMLAAAGVAVARSDGREDWGAELARVVIRAPLAPRMARFSAADRDAMDPSLRDAIAESEALSLRAVQEAPLLRAALYRQTEAVFEAADLLLTPCLGAPPPRIGHRAGDPIVINGETAGSLRANWYNYPAPFNLTGHPAISIPAGFTPDGLPVGLQAVAPWFGEQRLIDLAAAIERLQPWPTPPAFSAPETTARAPVRT